MEEILQWTKDVIALQSQSLEAGNWPRSPKIIMFIKVLNIFRVSDSTHDRIAKGSEKVLKERSEDHA